MNEFSSPVPNMTFAIVGVTVKKHIKNGSVLFIIIPVTDTVYFTDLPIFIQQLFQNLPNFIDEYQILILSFDH